MSYIKSSLTSGEKIFHYSRPHWIVFLSAVVWLVITLLILFFGSKSEFFRTKIVLNVSIYGIFAIITFLVALVKGIAAIIYHLSTEFGITNRRVIMKTGFLHRSAISILLSRIESINVQQGIWGRLLNYGSITISGTGGTRDPFLYIIDPIKFRDLVQQQIQPA